MEVQGDSGRVGVSGRLKISIWERSMAKNLSLPVPPLTVVNADGRFIENCGIPGLSGKHALGEGEEAVLQFLETRKQLLHVVSKV